MTAKITFEFSSPCGCSKEEFLSWINFNIGNISSTKKTNLFEHDFPLDVFVSELGQLEPIIEIEQ